MDKKCFQVCKTSKVDKEHVMVPTWLSETWICCNTHTLKKKEHEACASDVQIQVVCAFRMLCVCTICVDAIDHCGGGGF